MIKDFTHFRGRTRLLLPPDVLLQGRDGALPARYFLQGDHVVARTHGYLPLEKVSRTSLTVELVKMDSGFLPGMVPDEPLLLPAGQMVWRQGRLVPASAFAGRGFGRALGRRRCSFVALWFARDDVVFAGGLALAAAPASEHLAA